MYADDIALLANTFTAAQRLLHGLLTSAGTVGLTINASKSEVLTVPAGLDGCIVSEVRDGQRQELSRCSTFTYLSGQVPDPQDDLSKRRALAWGAFRSMRKGAAEPCAA